MAKPEASCNSKRPFHTWAQAEEALWHLLEDNWRNECPDRNRNLSVYRCNWCSRWHIGHNGALIGPLGDMRRTGRYELRTG